MYLQQGLRSTQVEGMAAKLTIPKFGVLRLDATNTRARKLKASQACLSQ